MDGKFADQSFEEIRTRCLDAGILFVDPMFPPVDASISNDPSGVPEGVEWVRASELVSDPQMFVDGATRFDVNQGTLGDCWMLAAMANLTMVEDLKSKVIPTDQGFGMDYAGIFHFRLVVYNLWYLEYSLILCYTK